MNTYIKLSRVIDNYGTVTVKAVDDMGNVITSGNFDDANNAHRFMLSEKKRLIDLYEFEIVNYNDSLRDNMEKLTKLINS